MRILFLLHEPPAPPTSGPRRAAFHWLEYVSQHAECAVIGFAKNAVEFAEWRQLNELLPAVKVLGYTSVNLGRSLPIQKIRQVTRGYPPVTAQYITQEMVGLVGSAMRSFMPDIVQCSSFHMYAYRNLCDSFGARVVLAGYNAFSLGNYRSYKVTPLSEIAAKVKYYYLYQAFKHIERSEYPRFTKTFTVAEPDTEWLNRNNCKLNASTIPIIVPDSICAVRGPHQHHSPPYTVVCMGNFAHAGIARGAFEFLNDSIPQIRSRFPNTRIALWSAHGLTNALHKKLTDYPDVEVWQHMPDYWGTLMGIDVLVFPQQCDSGIQVKVQEAMALGIPSVLSTTVAEGVTATHRENAMIVYTSSMIGDAVCELLQSPVLRTTVSRGSKEHIRQVYNSDRVGRLLMGLYEEVI